MAPILISKKTSSDDIAYKNIIPTFSWLCAFIWWLTCQGWSAGGVEQPLSIVLSYCIILFYYNFIIISAISILNCMSNEKEFN